MAISTNGADYIIFQTTVYITVILIILMGKIRKKNCDFVSVFPVFGQIYTVPDNIDYVYLQLSTNWAEEITVVFDLVE